MDSIHLKRGNMTMACRGRLELIRQLYFDHAEGEEDEKRSPDTPETEEGALFPCFPGGRCPMAFNFYNLIPSRLASLYVLLVVFSKLFPKFIELCRTVLRRRLQKKNVEITKSSPDYRPLC